MSALLYCANIATKKTISGTPQTRQKVVLAKTLLKRCGVVPPPFNVGLAMVTLIQATIARSASAPVTSSQMTPGANNQSRNHVLFDTERFLPAKYHGSLRS